MGTPDNFSFPCPHCKERCTEQSKPGMCDSFTIEKHRSEIGRFLGPGQCWKCAAWYELTPEGVQKIDTPENGNDWLRLPTDVKRMISKKAYSEED